MTQPTTRTTNLARPALTGLAYAYITVLLVLCSLTGTIVPFLTPFILATGAGAILAAQRLADGFETPAPTRPVRRLETAEPAVPVAKAA